MRSRIAVFQPVSVRGGSISPTTTSIMPPSSSSLFATWR
jgi:hypothetical protein